MSAVCSGLLMSAQKMFESGRRHRGQKSATCPLNKGNYDGDIIPGEDLMSFLITDQADVAELAAKETPLAYPGARTASAGH
ncbi:hypothetical protein [Corynebacterium occultum]|uniref:hypothetical protein n=1 Tax=Corynebacterium occultum TaxID=2675219 RepID=UPI0012E2705C|nr:hypothetical protein [Corynebacterium occultum]